MTTTNLNLDTIETTDSIQNAFLTKMNSNMQKLDNAYGTLKQQLLTTTGKDNISDAIQSFNTLTAEINNLKAIGNATSSDIKSGKTALVKGQTIIGTYNPPSNPIPTINVTLTGGYTEYISGYGAGINKDGVLVIWAMSNASAYEHIKFSDTSIGAGTIGVGWNLGGFDTADPVDVPHACTITDLANKTTIDITLNAYNVASASDYVLLNVTLTAS